LLLYASSTLHIVQRNFLSIDFEALGASDRKEVKGMEFVCRRCNHITKRNPYRVTTEDAGVVLLNMVVCSSCARLAKRLGLPAVKMKSAKTAAKTERDQAMTDSEPQSVQLRASIVSTV
jgi:hypothetical protein